MKKLFDTHWKPGAAVAVTAALFLPLLVLGGPAFARVGSAASEYASSSQYQYRIVICHLTHSRKHPGHTIRVSVHAWKGHKRHGDHLGACTGAETLAPKHGHGQGHSDLGKQHGKSAEHHGAGPNGESGTQHGDGHHGGHDEP